MTTPLNEVEIAGLRAGLPPPGQWRPSIADYLERALDEVEASRVALSEVRAERDRAEAKHDEQFAEAVVQAIRATKAETELKALQELRNS